MNVELQDADGNVMSAEQVQEFLKWVAEANEPLPADGE